MTTCPICRCDPYEYVDVGVGMMPVAITCCEAGMLLFSRVESPAQKALRRALRLRRSHSPRRKARARRLMRDLFGSEALV